MVFGLLPCLHDHAVPWRLKTYSSKNNSPSIRNASSDPDVTQFMLVLLSHGLVAKIVTISLHRMTVKCIDRAVKCLKGPAKSDRTEGFCYR